MFLSKTEYIYIGSAPCDEECAAVGAKDYDYRTHALAECRQYIEAIRKVLGPEPEGAHLTVKGEQHEFGMCYDVICKYDVNNEAAGRYAFDCEGKAPAKWADAGMEAPYVY